MTSQPENYRCSTVLDAQGYSYDQAHQRRSMTNTFGNTWTYDYDGLGQLTSALGQEQNGTARLAEQLHYVYDGAGNLTARTNHDAVMSLDLNNPLNQLSTGSRSGPYTVGGLVQGPAANWAS